MCGMRNTCYKNIDTHKEVQPVYGKLTTSFPPFTRTVTLNVSSRRLTVGVTNSPVQFDTRKRVGVGGNAVAYSAKVSEYKYETVITDNHQFTPSSLFRSNNNSTTTMKVLVSNPVYTVITRGVSRKVHSTDKD